MKRTELIKNAINRAVVVEDYQGELYIGWLVADNDRKDRYLLLPFHFNLNKVSLNVSNIKHIKYYYSRTVLW